VNFDHGGSQFTGTHQDDHAFVFGHLKARMEKANGK
jgi:hypothetical protein